CRPATRRPRGDPGIRPESRSRVATRSRGLQPDDACGHAARRRLHLCRAQAAARGSGIHQYLAARSADTGDGRFGGETVITTLMRTLLITDGAILILMGTVWCLQGINVLPGSFMSGQTGWAVNGMIAIAFGGVLAFASKRAKRK